MPRLSRVRDRVSLRRAVRTAARGDARHAPRGPSNAVHRAPDSRGLRARDASRVMRAPRLPSLFAGLAGRLGFASAMLTSTRSGFPERTYDFGLDGTRGVVALLEGCVMSGLFARTNRATRRTLRANDY